MKEVADAPVPGKHALVQSLVAGDADDEIELALASVREKTAQLERALHARDFCEAWRAARELWRALAHAEQLFAAITGAIADARRRLYELRASAGPLLALAPTPSPVAIQEASSRDRRVRQDTWKAEERRWRAARGGLSPGGTDAILGSRAHDRAMAEQGAPTAGGSPSGDARDVHGSHHGGELVESETMRAGARVDGEAATSTIGRPLPASIQRDLERAIGRSLDHVRLHGGIAGDATARSHDARAVAIGSDIYVRAGELEARDARELLAHEVAHTEQARAHQGSPVARVQPGVDGIAAAEQEADAFAAEFAARGGAASFRPSVAVPRGQVLRAPDRPALTHEQFEAAADNRVSQMARAGKPLNAAAYLHLNARELRAGLRDYLCAQPLALGDAQVRFVDGRSGFVAALLAPLVGDDDSAHVRMLRSWLLPVDLDALVDRNRPIFEAANPKDTAEYTRGPKGPATWHPAVAVAIGSALEVALASSLPRMVARLVAKTAELRARTLRQADQVSAPETLVPSTPLDWRVANALVSEPATVEVVAGGLTVQPGAEAAYRKLSAVHWLGEQGGPRNAVRVEPSDATAEEVAASILHAPTEAYRLRRIGPFYLVPDEAVPQHVRSAGTSARGELAAEDQLAFGAHDRYATESIDVETDRELGAHTRGSDQGGARSTSLLGAWMHIDEQLRGIARLVEPCGLADTLDAALAFHERRKGALAHMSGDEAARHGRALDLQRALLVQIGGELVPLVDSLGPLGAQRAPRADDPRRLAIQRLVGAARLSHLPQTGRAALAAAHDAQEESLYATLEATLGRAATFIELAMQAPAARVRASRAVFGEGLRGRAEHLRGALAALRMRALHGQAAPREVEDLYRQIGALGTDAQLVAEIGALATTFGVLDGLEDSGWVLLSETVTSPLGEASADNQIGRLETARRGAAELRAALETAHARWLTLQARAVAIGRELAAAGAKDAAAQGRAAIEADIAAAMAPLREIGGHAAVQTFLQHAHELAKSAERRALIAQIAVMVGVAIVSEGAGAYAEGLVAGSRVVAATTGTATAEAAAMAVRAAGRRALAAQLVGTAVNTAAFTALQATLSGGPLLEAFAANFVGNLAGFGALRGTRKELAGITAGKAGPALWAARTANLTAPLLVSAAVQFVQQECESQLRRGRTMSWDELQRAGVRTLAMMIGSAIAHHVLGNELRDMYDRGHEQGAGWAQRQRLEQLATEVATGGDPIKALALLADTRAYLLKLREARPDARMLARAKLGLQALNDLERENVPAVLGLDVSIPGQVYVGDHAAVMRVVDSYRRAGYYVEPSWRGYRVRKTPSESGPGIHLIDRTSDRIRTTDRPRSTRPTPTGDAHASGTTHESPTGRTPRVEQPIPQLYERISSKDKVADWEFYDVAHMTGDGTTHLKTKARAPDGAIGILYQTYQPATKTLEMKSIYADQLPTWIADGPALVPGQGIPTVTYLLHRQWKMLGVEYGQLRTVKLSTVEEIRTLVEFALQRKADVPPDIAILKTSTTAYVKTALVQSGHRITGAKVNLFMPKPLDDVLRRSELPHTILGALDSHAKRDPAVVARNDKMIADVGNGQITRTSVVDADFDVEYTLSPFHGQTVDHTP